MGIPHNQPLLTDEEVAAVARCVRSDAAAVLAVGEVAAVIAEHCFAAAAYPALSDGEVVMVCAELRRFVP